jgi:hypothetical protein
MTPTKLNNTPFAPQTYKLYLKKASLQFLAFFIEPTRVHLESPLTRSADFGVPFPLPRILFDLRSS